MALEFQKTIKAGDILTSITILVSVVALILSLAKDREALVSDQANRVRAAAASTLAKLDRWQAVQLSLYQDLQPSFVQLSEDLAKQYDVVSIRDRFWKQVGEARARVAKQVLDEQLSTSYADLLTHFPAARERVAVVLGQLSVVESKASDEFMAKGEQSILSLKGKQASYQTPDLGNALRAAAATGAGQFKAESDRLLEPVRQYLFGLIARKDDELVNARRSKDDA